MCTRTSYKYRWKKQSSWVAQTILIRLITSNIFTYILKEYVTLIYYIAIEVTSNK